MKRIGALLLALVLLTGCTGHRKELDRVMTLRAKLLGSISCTFDAEITADYGDAIHTFAMECQGDNLGNLLFRVTAPESISGITGEFTGGEGKLTFDDSALAFPLLADDQVTPVSGPWIFLKTLMGGYLTSCGQDGDYLRVTIDDSYEEDALRLDIWLNGEDVPVLGEIYYDGRRIVTLKITNFVIL